MTEKKKYKVVKEFKLPVLQEVGSVVELTKEQAVSGEFGPCIEPLENENKQQEESSDEKGDEEEGNEEEL